MKSNSIYIRSDRVKKKKKGQRDHLRNEAVLGVTVVINVHQNNQTESTAIEPRLKSR